MIDIRELRIGNLLLDIDNNLVAIEGVVKDRIYYQSPSKERGIHANYSVFKPIPLTEEWLVKLGFEKSTDGAYRNKVFGFVFYDGELSYDVEKIKYVHQFQNLYFALTRQEL